MVISVLLAALDAGSLSWSPNIAEVVHCHLWDHWVEAVLTTSTLEGRWPMLPKSNSQQAAHKPHSRAWPPERDSAVSAAIMNQEVVSQRSCTGVAANAESESILLK